MKLPKIKYFVAVKFLFGVPQREVGKKGRKKGRGLRENFNFSNCLSESHFPFPWLGKIAPDNPVHRYNPIGNMYRVIILKG